VLVLTRKTGESIVIANNVLVKIVEVSPGVVRVGIEAPREVSILRAELHSEIGGANRLAASAGKLPEGLLAKLRGDAKRRDEHKTRIDPRPGR
jgi:carbon storage regulator